jgi:hypothetical protein
MRWLVAASLVVSLGASLAWAKTVRVFAVGSKLEVRYAETYQNFHDKMFAPVDVQHPRRSELVQADPDDVVSHLRGADRNAPELALVNFPEDVGVVAGLIGTGGALARRAATHSTGVQAAFFTLATNYAAQIEYYRNPFPRQQSIHYLLLAETATFYRSFYETFRDLARTYGMYVTATANVAPHIRSGPHIRLRLKFSGHGRGFGKV